MFFMFDIDTKGHNKSGYQMPSDTHFFVILGFAKNFIYEKICFLA